VSVCHYNPEDSAAGIYIPKTLVIQDRLPLPLLQRIP